MTQLDFTEKKLRSLLVTSLILFLYRLRHRFGTTLLAIAIGVFQGVQVHLAQTFYVEIMPGILVSPGSVVLFTAGLFAILLIYVQGDASEARKLCYALVTANLVIGVFSYALTLSLRGEGVHNLYNLPESWFVQELRIMVSGTIALAFDIVLILFLYERFSARLPRFLFLRIAATMVLVLVFDTFVFATLAFAGQDLFQSVLISGLIGKTCMRIFYSVILTLYLKYCESDRTLETHAAETLKDVFHYLTFRQKYEKVSDLNEGLFETNKRLQKALSEIKQLEKLLCICSHCKKIRDDKRGWQPLERYIGERTETKFSHGLCPDCLLEHYPEVVGTDGEP